MLRSPGSRLYERFVACRHVPKNEIAMTCQRFGVGRRKHGARLLECAVAVVLPTATRSSRVGRIDKRANVARPAAGCSAFRSTTAAPHRAPLLRVP
jgi:hypothetical protein